MDTLLHAGFSNAVAATVLALFALVITQVWRNQYAVNVLWLIVLLKLVTPPLIEVPIPFLNQVTLFNQRHAHLGSRVRNQDRLLHLDDGGGSHVGTSIPEVVVSGHEVQSPDFEIVAPGSHATGHSTASLASHRSPVPTAI